MKIGQIPIAHPLTLASLEEHSNYPFRLLMKQFGASLVVSERVDARRRGAADTPGDAAALHRTGRISPQRPVERRRRRRLRPQPKRGDSRGSTWSI